jgi:hypothetical protein
MEGLDTALLSNILFRCKHPKSAPLGWLDKNDQNFTPFSSYMLVSKQWAAKGLQILKIVRVSHNFEELDQASLQSLLECAPHITILDITFPITYSPNESSDIGTLGCSGGS